MGMRCRFCFEPIVAARVAGSDDSDWIALSATQDVYEVGSGGGCKVVASASAPGRRLFADHRTVCPIIARTFREDLRRLASLEGDDAEPAPPPHQDEPEQAPRELPMCECGHPEISHSNGLCMIPGCPC